MSAAAAKTITIAPVKKSIRVKASQARAFEVFTQGIGCWWPKDHGIGKKPMQEMVLEGKLGGRWYELSQDGSQATVGHILAWQPPHRFVVTWEISCNWEPDPGMGSEVEVRFTAESADTTLVELEHRLFERMGAEPGAKIRNDVDRGWPAMLEIFRREVEK
ncbi:MAG TPA: SRPBCC family protein [Candidatus Cybelea sp.]|nr:SRPBCC family protein [Candidatus Cybelea sp.]